MKKTILFVCTANVCRSPMAAALLRHWIGELGLADQIEVSSAGVWAERDHEAASDAIHTLATHGINISEHRSQPVTRQLLEQADIVLVMEESHRRSLFHIDAKYLGKTFLLSEMVGRHEEVADPYGGPAEGYVKTVALLADLLERGLPQILRRIKVAVPWDTSSAG